MATYEKITAGMETPSGRRRNYREPMTLAFVLGLFALLCLCMPVGAFAEDGTSEADAASESAQRTVVYHQSDGYEPYQGWQDAPWIAADDPFYDQGSSSGTTRKGYPGWSLSDPLSLGVTGATVGEGGAMTVGTGSTVCVVADTTKTDTSTAGTYTDPYYYKNIVLPSYDATSSAITFTFNYVGAGGADTTHLFDGHGGFMITTSDDPADWDNPDNVVWTANASDCSVTNMPTADNWWKTVTLTVNNSASLLSSDRTYYLVIKNGTAGKFARIYANIVFEFNTDANTTSSWDGDTSTAEYGREQGNGGTKLGIMDPEPSEVTTDLTKLGSCWFNQISTVQTLDDGKATIRVHADGSGSNWQTISAWTSACADKMFVYDVDPTSGGSYDASSLTPVCSVAAGTLSASLFNGDRDYPSVDGVNITACGLEGGKTYYLVFTADFQPSTTSSLGKPVVFEFTTEVDAIASWNIGADDPADVVAALTENGTLVVSGNGAMQDFSAGTAPWLSEHAADIREVAIGEGVTSVGAYAFSGLANQAFTRVSTPSTLESVGVNAFYGDGALVWVDLTVSANLATIADGAFCGIANGSTAYVPDTEVAALIACVPEGASAPIGGNIDSGSTALAIGNGGTVPSSATPTASTLADPMTKAGYTFTGWNTDAALMHPATSFVAFSKGTTYYARFVKSGESLVDPIEYPGAEGLDQKIQLLDLSKLPATPSKQPDIEYYGEDDLRFVNVITTPYNGNDDIVFAFNMKRGDNANGGDGAYQKSYSLPFVSIIDADGTTVATYDDGVGTLKLFNIVFDGVDGKAQGNTIYAMRIGVRAETLPAGTYTLRFGKDLGSNNGLSTLGKNVDFEFTVERPAQYELTYDTSGATAIVTGVNVVDDEPVDVVIPAEIDGKTVAGIADSAFAGAARISSVTVPARVTDVGDAAFSNMADLVWVKDLSQSATVPAWGTGVFAGSPQVTLFGYTAASTVKAAADASDNVTFAPIDDGTYVNGMLVKNGDTVSLDAAAPTAVVRIFKDGEEVTENYRGFVSNTNVATHPSTLAEEWQTLTGIANGSAQLLVRDLSGNDQLAIGLSCTGFAADASTDASVMTGAQGNGATIALAGCGAITTIAYDETLDAFDNYLTQTVDTFYPTFTLQLGGPGSAWDVSRWNWDDWTANHLNGFITLRDAQGQTVATIGDGLTWTSLTTSNSLALTIEPGILKAGDSYTLVAGKDVTGHNVASSLQTDVQWTFTAAATDISKMTVADIGAQKFTGEKIEPTVAVTALTPDVSLWSTSTGSVTTTSGHTVTFAQSTDYDVAYADNDQIGTATATVSGLGMFAGTTVKEYRIVEKLEDASWKRLWGEKALDTMGDIIEAGAFSHGGTVLIATNDGYWDALTAVGAAGLGHGCVLLTDGRDLSSQTAEQLVELSPAHVIICGGASAISEDVETQVKTLTGIVPVRCAGGTATGTACQVYEKAADTTGSRWSTTAIVATNGGYWDALAIAPYAYAKGCPIFLSEGSAQLSDETIKAMVDGGITDVIVVGGTSAVSLDVEGQIKGAGLNVKTRLAGGTAVDTSQVVAEFELSEGMQADKMAVATRDGYWDALTGAALCGKNNSVLVLAADDDRSAIDGFVKKHAGDIDQGYIFGGTAAVSEGTYEALVAATTRV